MWQSLQPVLSGGLLFLLINLMVTLALSALPSVRYDFHVKVDNLLPEKLVQMQAANPQQLDVLFLGTSQTNNGFATSAFEQVFSKPIKSFNMGLPGTRYDVMMSYMDTHIQLYGPPKLVLLEVSEFLVEPETNYYYLPALQYRALMDENPKLANTIRQNPWMPFNVRKELILGELSALYQFRSLFMPLSLQKKVLKSLGEGVSPFLGFRPTLDIQPYAPEELLQGASLPTEAEFLAHGWHPRTASPGMLSYAGIRENAQAAKSYYLDPLVSLNFRKLEGILAYFHRKKIPVVLVRWPSHPEYNRLFEDSKVYRPFWNGLQKARKAYHVSLIDLNSFNPDNLAGIYADTRHLTPNGAQKFSAVLAQQLIALPESSAIKASASH